MTLEELKSAVARFRSKVENQAFPPPTDEELPEYLRELDLKTIVVATKIDKLRTSSELLTALGALNAALALPDDQPFIFSAETAQGRPELWSAIQDALVNDAEERRR